MRTIAESLLLRNEQLRKYYNEKIRNMIYIGREDDIDLLFGEKLVHNLIHNISKIYTLYDVRNNTENYNTPICKLDNGHYDDIDYINMVPYTRSNFLIISRIEPYNIHSSVPGYSLGYFSRKPFNDDDFMKIYTIYRDGFNNV